MEHHETLPLPPRSRRTPKPTGEAQRLETIARRCRRVELQRDRLSKRHGLLMTKVITATEMCWYARRFLPELAIDVPSAAIWAFDLPDAWWEARAKYTLGRMIRDITAEWREHRGRDYDNASERLAGLFRDLGEIPEGWADHLVEAA
jgi:hypothetical protein